MNNIYSKAVEEALHQIPLFSYQAEPMVDVQNGIPLENKVPEPLNSAMTYSLLLPGKRLRPTILLASYHMFEAQWQQALPFACAIEMIHAYSLVHDDLPALDNDALRRGKPTNHCVFGENMAILAGDALLNTAYEIMLTSTIAQQNPANSLRAIGEIAKRSGALGMIAGQVMDVKQEGEKPTQDMVAYIHRHKTADLITASLVAGLMLAGADENSIQSISEYGQNLGIAFQLIDDLLDVQGTTEEIGKQVGMDEARGKLTWPAVVGIAQTRIDAKNYIDKALCCLQAFGNKGLFLQKLTIETLERTK